MGARFDGATLDGVCVHAARYSKSTRWPKTGVFRRFNAKGRGAVLE